MAPHSHWTTGQVSLEDKSILFGVILGWELFGQPPSVLELRVAIRVAVRHVPAHRVHVAVVVYVAEPLGKCSR